MCAGGRFSHGVAGEKPGLSAPARDTICPHSFVCAAHHPIPPNPPPPAHLSIPPSLPPLSLKQLMPAQQGILPWNAIPLFTPLLF